MSIIIQKKLIEAKKIIFPVDYDPINMFWLINKKGAYGARSGLLQVAKEIIIGLFKETDSKSYGNDNDNNNSNFNSLDLACEYKNRMTSCGSTENTLRRIINMMRNSGRFRFHN